MKYLKTYESIRYKKEDILHCAWYFKNDFNIENCDDDVDWRYEMMDFKNKRERYIKYFFTFTNEKKKKSILNKILRYFKSNFKVELGKHLNLEKFYADSFENDCVSVVLPIQKVRELSGEYEIQQTAKKYNL